MTQCIQNDDGDTWHVTIGRSKCLTNISGFVVTYANVGRIILSGYLSPREREQGTVVLLQRLQATAVGTTSAMCWCLSESAD